jgi:hypothetical protein
MDTELFGYPIITYAWVIGLSSISGTVKYLNEFVSRADSPTRKRNEILYFVRDVLSGVVSGLMAFWLCDSFSIKEPLNAVIVTIAGIMGNRAWSEFEVLLKSILLRMPSATVIPSNRLTQQDSQTAIVQQQQTTILPPTSDMLDKPTSQADGKMGSK